jgi:Flp pilus assembly protein TadG
MIRLFVSILRHALRDQSGQTLPLFAAGLLALLAISGLSVDLGHAYVVHSQLVASTDAAALAAAQSITLSGSAFDPQAVVNAWGAGTNGKNYPGLSTATATVQSLCLTSLLPNGITKCTSASGVNAVRVTQTTSAPTYFLKALGFSSIPMSATATAALRITPWNVAIVMDATGSMTTIDSNCTKSPTRFQCAMTGIQTLLGGANPCPPGMATCTDSAAIFRVSLFAFPNVSNDTVSYASNCGGSLNYDKYTLPVSNGTSYGPITYSQSSPTPASWTATYQIVGFSSDYYSPSSSNGLNTGSPLVKAVTGCMQPIVSPGTGTGGLNGASSGGITYFAGALYAAQAALEQEQQQYPQSQNAIIFLSDGQANLYAKTGDFPTAYTVNPSLGLSALTGTGSYPDATDECQQAIAAAQAAAQAGTRVYGIAYGSEQSGCTSASGGTDSAIVINSSSLNAPLPSLNALTPCVTIEDIASAESYFYSDYNQSGSGSTCQSQSHQITQLSDIFGDILTSLTKAILVPNTAT